MIHLATRALFAMTMGQNSSPTPPRSIDEETLETVRAALAAHLRHQPAQQPDMLHEALHAMTREAREKSILPEHLLVALKDIWYSLPEVRAKENGEQARVLQRVVSMCIREYFGEPRKDLGARVEELGKN
jgi:hypothetical protein